MEYEAFTAEVARAETILNAMAASKHMQYDFPRVDISIEACECAAMISGHDATMAKMMNKRFRDDAANVALGMARKLAGAVR